MNKKSGLFCPNENCKDYLKVGRENIVKNGKYKGGRRQLYECKSCGKNFSSRRNTVFYRLRVSEKDFIEAVQMMVEGASYAAIARVKRVKEETVANWFRKVAEQGSQFSDQFLRALDFTQCQIDDFWSFVKKKKSISKRVKTGQK